MSTYGYFVTLDLQKLKSVVLFFKAIWQLYEQKGAIGVIPFKVYLARLFRSWLMFLYVVKSRPIWLKFYNMLSTINKARSASLLIENFINGKI